VEGYVPKAYHGRVLVYAAKTQPIHHLLQVEAAWESISTQIEVVHIDGTHLNLMRQPRVISVANHLGQRLKELNLENTPISGPRSKNLSGPTDASA
jgi:thioesterase domain-containing protein